MTFPRKLALVAAVAAIAAAAPASPSKADVDFHFGFQFPQLEYRHDRGHHYRERRHHRRISCHQARRLVRDHGFHRIRTRDCNGRVYTFNARRHGDRYRVRVNARRGTIISARRR